MQPTQTPLPNLGDISDWAFKLSNQIDRNKSRSLRGWWHWRRACKIANELNIACKGDIAKDGLKAIRLFIAGGISFWVANNRKKTPDEMILYILWPLIIAPKLPNDWYEHFQGISAPPLAAFVKVARAKVERHGQLYYFLEAWTDLTPAVYQIGLPRILDDMRDPKRGGLALDAIRLCADFPPIPIEPHSKTLTLVKWLIVTSAAGAIGNRFDENTKELWGSMVVAISSIDQASAHASSESSDIAEDLIDGLFDF